MIEEKLPEVVCSGCGQAGRVVRFARAETVKVRGLDLRVTKVLRRCEDCGAEFENTKDPDWRLEAYAKVRAETGLLTPERIVQWRKSYDLTQAEVTTLLNWGEVTLGRYEKGALQTDGHNDMLVDLMKPENLAAALVAKPTAVPDDKRRRILGAIRTEMGLLSIEDLRIVRVKYGLTEAEMDRMLSLETDTWSAWERGEGVHSKATDTLVRELAEHPDLVRHLLSKAGIESPAANGVLSQIDIEATAQVADVIRRKYGAEVAVDVETLVRLAGEELRRAQPKAAARIGRAA